MRHRLRKPRRVGHRTVASYLALFLALGGAAWAAATVGSDDVVNNSLRSGDLKNRVAVKSPDVSNRSIGGADIRNNALARADFGLDSVGGADVRESTLLIGRVFRRLGGAMNEPVGTSLAIENLPNGAFTQGPDESDLILGTAQVTFAPTCTAPRQFFGYLLLDNPVLTATSIIGSFSKFDPTGSAGTFRVALGLSPFTVAGASLFRTGSPAPHQLFLQAAGTCNSGAGVTLDSVDLQVVGHR